MHVGTEWRPKISPTKNSNECECVSTTRLLSTRTPHLLPGDHVIQTCWRLTETEQSQISGTLTTDERTIVKNTHSCRASLNHKRVTCQREWVKDAFNLQHHFSLQLDIFTQQLVNISSTRVMITSEVSRIGFWQELAYEFIPLQLY